MHHFVHPNWFENLGGFTKEANIPIFVEFARTAFRYVRFCSQQHCRCNAASHTEQQVL